MDHPVPRFSPSNHGEGTSHDVILLRLDDLQKDVSEVLRLAQNTNGRVNKHDTSIGILRWAVFSGGVGIIAALTYLIKIHMIVTP